MAKRKQQNDEPNDENINNEADDTFGLPEIEYEPIKREEPSTPEPEPEPVAQPVQPEPVAYQEEEETIPAEEHQEEFHSAYNDMEEKPSVWPKVLGFLLVFAVAAGLIWYFVVYKPKHDAELKAQQEQRDRDEAARLKAEEERLAELRRKEAEQRRLDSLNNLTPKEGSIEALKDRTGRYYVVVASAIDDDLLMDFANKLSKKGKSCYLIPPFGKHKFYRLAIEARDSYDEAQGTADGMKGGDFGEGLWVVKY